MVSTSCAASHLGCQHAPAFHLLSNDPGDAPALVTARALGQGIFPLRCSQGIPRSFGSWKMQIYVSIKPLNSIKPQESGTTSKPKQLGSAQGR